MIDCTKFLPYHLCMNFQILPHLEILLTSPWFSFPFMLKQVEAFKPDKTSITSLFRLFCAYFIVVCKASYSIFSFFLSLISKMEILIKYFLSVGDFKILFGMRQADSPSHGPWKRTRNGLKGVPTPLKNYCYYRTYLKRRRRGEWAWESITALWKQTFSPLLSHFDAEFLFQIWGILAFCFGPLQSGRFIWNGFIKTTVSSTLLNKALISFTSGK